MTSTLLPISEHLAAKQALRVLAPRITRTTPRNLRRPAFSHSHSSVNQVQLFRQALPPGWNQQRWHSAFPSEARSRVYEFEDVKNLVENPSNNTILIDVREPSEYQANSIPTSLNIPITSQPDALLLPADEFADRFGFAKPPLDHEIVFFCKAGVRSSAAAQIAKQGGYEKVGEYRGSWLDWERNGGLGTRTGPTQDTGLKGEKRSPGETDGNVEINEGSRYEPARDDSRVPGQ